MKKQTTSLKQSKVSKINKQTFISHNDGRGSLLPISLKDVDFEVKRMFVVNNVPVDQIRGDHAHYKTKQLIICTKGKVNVLVDDGAESKEILLNQFEGVLVPEMIWDNQEFLEEGSELVVLCSTEYEPEDYILDYEEFKKLTQ